MQDNKDAAKTATGGSARRRRVVRADERLQAGPESGEGGDPGAHDRAAVHVHLAQPAVPGRPARAARRAQVAHGRAVELREHAQVGLVAEQQVRLRRPRRTHSHSGALLSLLAHCMPACMAARRRPRAYL